MPNAAIIEDVPLDFTSPYDELTELRSLLTTQEIAELTGLRRETISRARPDSHFQRRTEKALRDLYVVVTRMRSVNGRDLGQLGAVLRRPQAAFDGSSMADLLREEKVDRILELLATPPSPRQEGRERFRLSPDTEAKLKAYDPAEADAAAPAIRKREERRVAAFLAADPELAALLPEIEERVRHHFAPVERIDRGVSVEYEGEGDDELYLEARNGLSFDENFERLAALLEHESDLLRPVRTRLTIGFL
jgi:hypothetical protein